MTSEAFDDVFTHVAKQAGGIQPFLDEFFSFLHRKTDFYVVIPEEHKIGAKMGFSPNVARNMVLESFHKYPYKEYDNKPATNTAAEAVSKAPIAPIATARFTAEGKQIPIGNGGFGPNYYWIQTLQEVTVYIDVPSSTRAKDLLVDVTPKHLSIRFRGSGKVLVDGDLEDTIKLDDALWTFSECPGTDSQIIMNLEKLKKTWWEHVIVGHDRIDTSLVDSSQRIDEYDEATQAAIRKIVHEQRNKQQLY